MLDETQNSYIAAIERHGALITKICYYFSNDAEDFKDLRQETLLNIWKGWNTFRGEAERSTWFYRICFNSCITYRRKERGKSGSISIEQIADVPMEETFDARDYDELHALISQLSHENKAILLLWLDEKNYDEISVITGLSRNAVATRLHRIKQMLIKMSNQ